MLRHSGAQCFGIKLDAEHGLLTRMAHLLLVLRMAARLEAPLTVRFACLCHDLGKGTTPVEVLPRHIGHEQRSARLAMAVCDRWKVPTDCLELADVVAREHGNVHLSGSLDASAVMRLLERCDAMRRPDRFRELLLACECDARGRLNKEDEPYPQRPRLQTAMEAALGADTAAVASHAIARGLSGPAIGAAVHAARVHAVAASLSDAA